MRCMLALLCSLAGVSLAAGEPSMRLVLVSVGFHAYETHTITVQGALSGEEGSGQRQLSIKGIVSRPPSTLVLEGEEQGDYADLNALSQRALATYCKREYVPAGESVFNAGRNISAELGDYVPANLRITVNYRYRGGANTLSNTFTCLNSMRE